jgi:hypothetical protein
VPAARKDRRRARLLSAGARPCETGARTAIPAAKARPRWPIRDAPGLSIWRFSRSTSE